MTAVDLNALRGGFNVEDVTVPTNADAWRDHSFLDELALLKPQLLRFGGTTTMWTNWETGAFVKRNDLPDQFRRYRDARRGLTLADYAQVISMTGAIPVFDLNMVTSSLDHELRLLQHAAELGLRVAYIELGNELYDTNFARYVDRFPTGAAYGTVANIWIAAIKAAFPNALIGVSMWDAASPITNSLPPRIQQWNATLLSVVRDEDALVFHPYWRIASSIRPGAPASVTANLVAPVQYWNAVQQADLRLLPPGTKAWLTEWNLALESFRFTNPPPTQNWAQALGVAWFALATMSDERVGMSLHHDVISQSATAAFFNGELATQRYGRTPDGEVLALVYSNLQIGEVPTRRTISGINRPTSAIIIEVDGLRPKLLIVNLGATNFRPMAPWPNQQCSVTTVTGDPAAVFDGTAANAALLQRTTATTSCESVAVAPYSVSAIARG